MAGRVPNANNTSELIVTVVPSPVCFSDFNDCVASPNSMSYTNRCGSSIEYTNCDGSGIGAAIAAPGVNATVTPRERHTRQHTPHHRDTGTSNSRRSSTYTVTLVTP